MLPHDLHEATALQVFAAGKHLLLEKPMATTVEACERILAASRQSDRVFMVGETAQYWPEVLAARELIRQGRIGRVLGARTMAQYAPSARVLCRGIVAHEPRHDGRWPGDRHGTAFRAGPAAPVRRVHSRDGDVWLPVRGDGRRVSRAGAAQDL
jgi:predicted dehydrogenase